MLTPDYLANCTDVLLGLYDELDRTIIADIARRIVKTGGVSDTADIQIDRVQQSGALLDEVTKQVAALSGHTEAEIKRMFEDAGIQNMRNDARPLILAGQTAIPGMERDAAFPVLNGQTAPLRLSPAMRQTLDAAIAKTNGDLRNLTLTTGVTAMGKYMDATNAAYMMVQSGAFSYRQAIRAAVKQAAADGNWVSYASGHRDRLDVAVRRSVLTGINQTAAKLTELYSSDLGAEYYEVTAHAGARPSHAVWQGRVYKISGSAPGYPNFAETTGYGTGAGLCGWNCRHSFYPFWPSLSVPAYTPEKLLWYDAPRYEYGGEKLTEYEVSQKMRENERGIRAVKRELAGYRAAIDAATDSTLRGELQDAFDAASVDLKAREAVYKDLCRKTRHTPDSARTAVVAVLDNEGRVVSYNRSTAQKARRAKEKVTSMTKAHSSEINVGAFGGSLGNINDSGLSDLTTLRNNDKITQERPEKEQEILKRFNRYLPGTRSEAEKLAQVNPNFDFNSYEWSHNCQRCVIAYELVERGYDVTARPFNAKDPFGDVGTRAFNVRAPDLPLTIPDAYVIYGDFQTFVKQRFEEWGENARAMVRVMWDKRVTATQNYMSHAFVVKKINGNIVYLDPQINKVRDIEDTISKCAPETFQWIMRMDNKDFSDLVVYAAENRKDSKR